jgi:hypothetical protein
VGRPKQRDKYLQFQGNMTVAPEHDAILKSLSPPQLEHVVDEIQLEMTRAKVGFTFINGPVRGIAVSKAVPITGSLSEDSFIASLDQIDGEMLLAREAIRLTLASIDTSKTTPPK